MPATATQPQLETVIARSARQYAGTFSGVGEWVESHPIVSMLALLAIFLCDQLGYSLPIPRCHDEIFTWYIAQAPVRELLHLTSTIDLNPPLSYLITRIVFQVFGAGTLQLRGPELVGYALAIVCIFFFVRRRAGTAYGLLAATILVASKATEPAILGRPYGLMFGFGAAALLAWQTSAVCEDRGSKNGVSTFLLGITLSALLLTHVFGLFAWAAVAAAEFTRCMQWRRVSASRILALTVPLSAIYFYIPIVRLHDAAIYPAEFQAHFINILPYYVTRNSYVAIAAFCAISLLFAFGRLKWLWPASGFPFTGPEWSAIGVLLLTPAALIVLLSIQHASLFYRYADVSVLGFGAFFTALLWRLTYRRSAPAVLAVIILLVVSSRFQQAFLFAARGEIFHAAEPPQIPYHPEAFTAQVLPVVVDSGLVFVQMNNYEPAAELDRTYYLTGGPIAVRYTHASIFEGIPHEIDVFHLHGHSEPYSSFLRQHPHFYLLANDHDYPEDWLLRKLRDDGAHLTLLAEVPSSYRDHNLYEVRLPALN